MKNIPGTKSIWRKVRGGKFEYSNLPPCTKLIIYKIFLPPGKTEFFSFKKIPGVKNTGGSDQSVKNIPDVKCQI